MRVIRREVEGKVALINRLIAAFHGSETPKKTFSHSLEPPTLSLAAEFRVENA